MLRKIQKLFYQLSEIMELVMAAIVAFAVIFAVIRVVPGIMAVFDGSQDLMQYLGRVFSIVIAVEFLKMLCRPTFDTVIDVLIFLIARHMIITETSPLENLLAVISIVILFFVQDFMKNGGFLKKKESSGSTAEEQ